MKKVIVIGGGWAGLSAAVELAQKGLQVTLLEQSGKLGGRASSFLDNKTGSTLDNGQHLFMSCYHQTINFLKKIGSLEKLKFQENLSVDFVNLKGKVSTLKCRPFPSPFHLLSGLAFLDTISCREKIGLWKVYRAVKKWNGTGPVANLTIDEWLKKLGQSERSRKHFWDIIALATLNDQPSIAEAPILLTVIKKAFFTDRKDSLIAIPTIGLSDLCGSPSEKFLNEHGGKILRNTMVSKITAVGDSVRGVVLRNGSTMIADFYVSALPFFVLRNILSRDYLKTEFFSKIQYLESSPIFSISLWFDRPITDREFLAMLDTRVQWLFNKGKILSSNSAGNHVSLVISGAHQYLEMTNDAILKMCMEELQQCFSESRSAKLQHHMIMREKNATLSPKVGFSKYRLPQKTPLKNLFLCGDWTDTGLPATIESAVFSGVKAASYLSE